MEKIFSFIIPTLNSEKTLGMCLESIVNQDFDLSKVEILVIDGGSTDNTRKIALDYGARVLDNPMVQQEYAKHIGILNATGKYLVFIDSDEVLYSRDSLKKRFKIFSENPNVKFIIFSGYITPKESNVINKYINSWGDPFAYFMYSENKSYPNFYELVRKRYLKSEFDDFAILDKEKIKKKWMLVDISASNCLDRESLSFILGEKLNSNEFIPKVFYLYLSSYYDIAILKDSPVVHYSSDSFEKFLSKLRWRVIVNIHYPNIPGTGFSNREEYLSSFKRLKKYLFLPYSFSLILPFWDGLVMSIKSKSFVFLLHPFLSLYVSINILVNYFLKLLGIKPSLSAYGKKKEIGKI